MNASDDREIARLVEDCKRGGYYAEADMLLALKARAEAAEKREASLREALEEIEDLAFVKLIDAYSIARAALEDKT